MRDETQAGSELSDQLGTLLEVLRRARSRKFLYDVHWLVELPMTDAEYDLFNSFVEIDACGDSEKPNETP